MSEDGYQRKNVTWSAVGDSGTFAEPLVVADGQEVTFTLEGSVQPGVKGVTVYDAASGAVVAALARDESGEFVRVDPSEAVIGVALSADGARWLRSYEADDS